MRRRGSMVIKYEMHRTALATFTLLPDSLNLEAMGQQGK